MVVSGDRDHDFVSILIATTDIKKGEKISLDYFQDWDKLESSLSLFLTLKQGVKITFNDEGDYWPNPDKDVIPARHERNRMLLQMFSNGFIDKASGRKLDYVSTGCRRLSAVECNIKKSMKHLIESDDIFDIAVGTKDPPQWMGQELIDQQYRFTF